MEDKYVFGDHNGDGRRDAFDRGAELYWIMKMQDEEMSSPGKEMYDTYYGQNRTRSGEVTPSGVLLILSLVLWLGGCTTSVANGLGFCLSAILATIFTMIVLAIIGSIPTKEEKKET